MQKESEVGSTDELKDKSQISKKEYIVQLERQSVAICRRIKFRLDLMRITSNQVGEMPKRS